MAKKDRMPNADAEKQRPSEEAKRGADEARLLGKQPHGIAQEANMKRQQKKMHNQDNK